MFDRAYQLELERLLTSLTEQVKDHQANLVTVAKIMNDQEACIRMLSERVQSFVNTTTETLLNHKEAIESLTRLANRDINLLISMVVRVGQASSDPILLEDLREMVAKALDIKPEDTPNDEPVPPQGLLN